MRFGVGKMRQLLLVARCCVTPRWTGLALDNVICISDRLICGRPVAENELFFAPWSVDDLSHERKEMVASGLAEAGMAGWVEEWTSLS